MGQRAITKSQFLEWMDYNSACDGATNWVKRKRVKTAKELWEKAETSKDYGWVYWALNIILGYKKNSALHNKTWNKWIKSSALTDNYETGMITATKKLVKWSDLDKALRKQLKKMETAKEKG